MGRMAIMLAGSLLAATFAAAQKPALKVYLSVDMEGISGVVQGDQVSPESREYPAARKWMAEDVNAVVAGLLEAGATEIVVNDSHGGMRNISPDDLSPRASLISGTPKPLAMMAGLDGSFAAVVFVGYHAGAGSATSILDHTISGSTVAEVRVNGVVMPELGLNAAIAGWFGVPVVMLSGDAAACGQASSLLGEGLVTVAVKEALGRTAAKLLPFVESRRKLQDGARQALLQRDRYRPFLPKPPYAFAVSFLNSGQVEYGELLPMVTRTSPRTLSFTTQDYLEGARILRALIVLATAR